MNMSSYVNLGDVRAQALKDGDIVLLNKAYDISNQQGPYRPYLLLRCVHITLKSYLLDLEDIHDLNVLPFTFEMGEADTVWIKRSSSSNTEVLLVIIDLSHYPHHCPRCDGPAYIGAINSIDCAKGCY